jgi:hypothetical protein
VALRYHRSVRLGAGAALNLNTHGASLSAGPFNLSPSRGLTAGFSLPGTGLSYRIRLTPTKTEMRRMARANAAAEEKRRLISLADEMKDVRAAGLDREGRVQLVHSDGRAVTSAQIDQLWRVAAPAMRQLTDEAAQSANRQIAEGLDVHLGTPCVNETRYPEPEFADLEPPPFSRMIIPARRVPALIFPARSLAEYVIPARRREYRAKVAAARAAYTAAVQAEDARRNSLEAEQDQRADEANAKHVAWEAAREAFIDAEFQRYLNAMTMADADYIGTLVSSVLSHVAWPCEMNLTVDISRTCTIVVLGIDLPDADAIPLETLVFLKSRQTAERRTLSSNAAQQRYLRFVHAILFRSIGETFATAKSIEKVFASAFSELRSHATGKLERECILSVCADRTRWSELSFDEIDAIDPVEALARFPHHRRSARGTSLAPVVPLASDFGE